MDPPLLGAAVELAALGWPMFFIRPRDKQPFARTGGFKDATTDEQALRDVFKRRRGRVNLAVATGAPGPTVLDVDDPKHADAQRLLGQLNGLRQPVSATARGQQLFFAGSTGKTVPFAWGELRSTGSYVIVPPSIHPTGKEYVWLESPSGQLPPLPDLLTGLQRTDTAGRGELEPKPLIAFGERHDALKDFAVRLLRGGIVDQGVLEEQLQAYFRARFEPDPPPRKGEFRDIARWAVKSNIAERERTVGDPPKLGKSKGKGRRKTGLEHPPAGDAPLAEHRAYIRTAGGWPGNVDVAEVRRFGTTGQDRLEIVLSNGQRIVFYREDHITTRGQWVKTIIRSTHGIADPIPLSDREQGKVYRSLCILANALPEEREREDLQDVLDDFLNAGAEIIGYDLADQEGRFAAIAACHQRGEWDPKHRPTAGETDHAPVVLVDVGTGERYIRAGELQKYVNWRNLKIETGALRGRMRMLGVEYHVLYGREPQRPDGKRRRTRKLPVYRLPPEPTVGDDEE